MKHILGISVITATMLMAGGDFSNINLDKSSSYDETLRAEIEALKNEISVLKQSLSQVQIQTQSKNGGTRKKMTAVIKIVKNFQIRKENSQVDEET